MKMNNLLRDSFMFLGLTLASAGNIKSVLDQLGFGWAIFFVACTLVLGILTIFYFYKGVSK